MNRKYWMRLWLALGLTGALGCAAGGDDQAVGSVTTTGGDPVATGGSPLMTGGTVASGGMTSGGAMPTGGTITGGMASGGTMASGGMATGGMASGGTTPTGGMITGGMASGGTPVAEGAIPLRGPAPTRETALKKGPYNVVSTKDGLRDGPDYSTQTLHYPTDAEPPFAYVAIVPGFVSPEESIINWGPFLASHGMVVLTLAPNTPTDQPDVRAKALLDGLVTLREEHTKSGGPLSGKLALDHYAVAGWSMGGGGATIVANTNKDAGLRAAMSFCGWQPGYQASSNTVPTIWFASLGDPLAGGQSQGFYDSTPDSTPKTLMEMPGGDHWIANDPASYQGQVGLMGLSWMKTFLEGDERYRQFLTQEPDGLTDWRTNL